jgi:hypothetical protein
MARLVHVNGNRHNEDLTEEGNCGQVLFFSRLRFTGGLLCLNEHIML